MGFSKAGHDLEASNVADDVQKTVVGDRVQARGQCGSVSVVIFPEKGPGLAREPLLLRPVVVVDQAGGCRQAGLRTRRTALLRVLAFVVLVGTPGLQTVGRRQKKTPGSPGRRPPRWWPAVSKRPAASDSVVLAILLFVPFKGRKRLHPRAAGERGLRGSGNQKSRSRLRAQRW